MAKRKKAVSPKQELARLKFAMRSTKDVLKIEALQAKISELNTQILQSDIDNAHRRGIPTDADK